MKSLEDIRKLLQVSPGSTILLRGHVDNAHVPEFRKQGGEAFVRTQALKAMELSKQRAEEIKRVLMQKQQVDAEAARSRRPWVGRAGGCRFGAEPARRSAVVHSGVTSRLSTAIGLRHRAQAQGWSRPEALQLART